MENRPMATETLWIIEWRFPGTDDWLVHEDELPCLSEHQGKRRVAWLSQSSLDYRAVPFDRRKGATK